MFEQYSIQDSVKRLDSNMVSGLSEAEVRKRLSKYGRNVMQEPKKKTPVESFVEQLNDPLIYVLIAAAVISVILREQSDAVIIGVVVTVNALVGVIQEGKARKALDALKKMTTPHATVIRGGVRREIPAAEIVPGDVVCLEAGALVPADMRLIESANLKTEESALTGESLPIEKDAQFLVHTTGEVPLGDRRNMVYMSTMVTYGRAKGVVTATGMETEIGHIAEMITSEKEEMTPLQKRLGELGKVLSILSLGLCMALFVLALWQKRNPMEMLLTAISLAVAAVPEGLPAVVTICLALSVTRMVRVNTIVRRLPSVETLGAVSVVCSDKTGTLTQNRMTVEKCFLEGKTGDVGERGFAQRMTNCQDFIQGMVLCNDASIASDNLSVDSVSERIGDPTELALLDFGRWLGHEKTDLEQKMPRCGELPFDSDRKMMTTFHRYGIAKNESRKRDGVGISYTKGAPDEVLKHCTHILRSGEAVRMTERFRRQILEEVQKMSSQALRTLALAMRADAREALEDGLIFLGLVGMRDPARPEAAEAVEIFRKAGVETVMITGDHVDTAYAIGKQLRIVQSTEQCVSGEEMTRMEEEEFLDRLDRIRVFARVSPAQKVRIVKGFRRKGKIVAMTGDGVNDAPSLKAADIGIAMGLCGTDVAKQASDMILTDDNFATIEKAIEEGRGVYENIRKSVIFLLSSNLGEIMTMFIAVLCGFASPLKSAHILWINLITDSLPALALGIDYNDGKSLMRNLPRKKNESLFARGGLSCTCFYGCLIAAISLTAFLMLPCMLLYTRGELININNLSQALKWGNILPKAQTYAFTVLGMSQLFHAVGMRDTHCSVLRMNPLRNKLMIAACMIGILLQFAVTEVPFLIRAFGTSHLSWTEWGMLSILAAFPLFAHEVIALIGRNRS